MSYSLVLLMSIFTFILFMTVIYLLRKRKIPVKYALIWIFSIIFILLLLLVPNLMENIADLLGFELLSNMVLCLFLGLLMFISIALTVMIASQKKKTTILIQEISILKQIINDIDNNKL